MKNCILKGVCVFFMLMTLFLLLIPAVFAQSGTGGSTEVIAHVEKPTTAPTEAAPAQNDDTQPLPSSGSVSQDGTPIRTGEAIAWLAFIALLIAFGVLLFFGLKGSKRSP